MHQHRSQELPFGVDFTRPEPKLRRFDRTILRSHPHALSNPPCSATSKAVRSFWVLATGRGISGFLKKSTVPVLRVNHDRRTRDCDRRTCGIYRQRRYARAESGQQDYLHLIVNTPAETIKNQPVAPGIRGPIRDRSVKLDALQDRERSPVHLPPNRSNSQASKIKSNRSRITRVFIPDSALRNRAEFRINICSFFSQFRYDRHT